MSDRREDDSTLKERIASLETLTGVMSNRLNVVSERTHTFAGKLGEVALLAEEAQGQRVSILNRQDSVERQLNQLDNSVKTSINQFQVHSAACDKRGARLEKLIWAALVASIAAFGYLIKYVIEHPIH